jgi:hypothetical protein
MYIHIYEIQKLDLSFAQEPVVFWWVTASYFFVHKGTKKGTAEAVPSSNPRCDQLRFLRYFEVVLYGEGSEDLAGPDASDLLVHRTVDHAVEA